MATQDLTRSLIELCGASFERDVRFVADRPGHDRRYLLDSSKVRAELGWTTSVEFAAGLAATVGWYRANEAWWRPLIGRSPVVEGSWGAAPTASRAPADPPGKG